jgi:hypothetical protein
MGAKAAVLVGAAFAAGATVGEAGWGAQAVGASDELLYTAVSVVSELIAMFLVDGPDESAQWSKTYPP